MIWNGTLSQIKLFRWCACNSQPYTSFFFFLKKERKGETIIQFSGKSPTPVDKSWLRHCFTECTVSWNCTLSQIDPFRSCACISQPLHALWASNMLIFNMFKQDEVHKQRMSYFIFPSVVLSCLGNLNYTIGVTNDFTPRRWIHHSSEGPVFPIFVNFWYIGRDSSTYIVNKAETIYWLFDCELYVLFLRIWLWITIVCTSVKVLFFPPYKRLSAFPLIGLTHVFFQTRTCWIHVSSPFIKIINFTPCSFQIDIGQPIDFYFILIVYWNQYFFSSRRVKIKRGGFQKNIHIKTYT